MAQEYRFAIDRYRSKLGEIERSASRNSASDRVRELEAAVQEQASSLAEFKSRFDAEKDSFASIERTLKEQAEALAAREKSLGALKAELASLSSSSAALHPGFSEALLSQSKDRARRPGAIHREGTLGDDDRCDDHQRDNPRRDDHQRDDHRRGDHRLDGLHRPGIRGEALRRDGVHTEHLRPEGRPRPGDRGAEALVVEGTDLQDLRTEPRSFEGSGPVPAWYQLPPAGSPSTGQQQTMVAGAGRRGYWSVHRAEHEDAFEQDLAAREKLIASLDGDIATLSKSLALF